MKPLIIASYTFKEFLKSKILLNTFFLGFALLILTFVAQQFTFGEPSRIALDFGIGVLSLSTIGIAIFMGVGLISKEIEQRTVYMVISRPVTRANFIFGRLLGLCAILIVNMFILSLFTLSLYFFIDGKFSPMIFWTLVFIALEALIILLIVSLFSLLTSNAMSVMMTVIVFLCGHAINEAQITSFTQSRPELQWVLNLYQYILPALYKLNFKDYLLYQQNITSAQLITGLGYGVSYSLTILILIILIFNKKNLD